MKRSTKNVNIKTLFPSQNKSSDEYNEFPVNRSPFNKSNTRTVMMNLRSCCGLSDPI